MKRKLVDFDVFKKMEKESLSTAEVELMEAEDILAQAMGLDDAELHCYGESDVIYSTPDDTYIYASYKLDDDAIILENIEELVLDESQEQQNARKLLATMVEELVEGNEGKANNLFEEYINLSITKRVFAESKKHSTKRLVAQRKKVGGKWKVTGYKAGKKRAHPGKSQSSGLVSKRAKAKRASSKRLGGGERERRKKLRQQAHRRFGFMKEAANAIVGISNNVLEYVNYVELGPVIRETVAKHDTDGNIVALRIPRSNVRNEGKILSFNWKTLNTDLKVCRDAGKNLAENMDFCKAVAELKRHNAFDDSDALQTTLENIVVQWPHVVYTTHKELAGIVKEALQVIGVTNWDDETCTFMAEGILRTAHSVHTDRVEKVLKLANSPTCKDFECFEEVVNNFYPKSLQVGELANFKDFG